MKTAYLIIYDNNVLYEESTINLLIVATKRQADQVVDELNEWLKRTWKRFPKEMAYEDPDQWEQWNKKREKHLKRMRIPYGLECLREEFKYSHKDGRVSSQPIKFLFQP